MKIESGVEMVMCRGAAFLTAALLFAAPQVRADRATDTVDVTRGSGVPVMTGGVVATDPGGHLFFEERAARQPAKRADDRTTVETTIRDAIGWALTKDRTRLESIMAHDADFFIFHPDSKTTVRGYESFARMIPGFMDPRFKATRFEMKDLRPVFSRSGDVAWFSAMLEDCGAWMGKESCWKETRWTGVLEKREGRWLIVQMHFSFAKDNVLAECPKAEPKVTSAAGNEQ